ncbi:signal peptidase II [Parachlamydia sp. AcF125]|uniref:signal peptidase II n=1 Tax=Parachlamydia sp. AcF125 TaxID=2795736 RepID=UPI001BCA14BF|nr:signal peptidase II [Parachlamydia sp. AcF125]MBS4167563.1 Lipoprotein signal peptidase [Parachlamydia sp. AcF125]
MLKFKALWISILVLISDMTSKYCAFHYLPKPRFDTYRYPYGGVPVFQNFFGIQFSLNYVENRGAIGGIFADFQEYLLIFRILLIIFLFCYLLFYRYEKKLELPFALIIGGAIGNIVDYFLYGHVVDMFHFVLWGYDYPVFNLADSAICIGIGWIFIHSFISGSLKFSSKSNVR